MKDTEMKNANHKNRSLRARNSETGAALITSIFALLLVTVLGVALMGVGEISRTISTNDRENTEALYMADSGLAHARKLLFSMNVANYTSVLTAGDGQANTGDELSTNLFASPVTAETSGGHAFAYGSYSVRVNDDSDEGGTQNFNADVNKRIVVRSTGIGRNGSTATVEAILSVAASPAIIVNGNLNISGNPVLRGSGGSLHTNATLDFDGSSCADGYFSATGSVIDPGNGHSGAGCGGPGDIRSSQPPIAVPTYNIFADFKALATYVMGINGKVYNSAGVQIDDANGDGKWVMPGGGEWSWDSGGKRWTLGGDTVLNATFYSEGNLSISGNPGTAGSPKTMTLIAEGYIEISGNPTFRPHLQNYSIMAGTDLKMNGNAGSGTPNYEGIHYAGHQIDFSGNPGINGQIIARNLADTASPGGVNLIPLQSGYMKISGNPNVTYNGGANDATIVAGWREIRN